VIAASSFEKAAELAEVLLPVLSLLARGSEAAQEAGETLLAGLSRELWRQALRLAPAEALAMSLQGLRVPDTTDPNNNIVWGPAAHLAAAPRSVVRLLGLTSGA
jgi:type VI protein secretion system component VasF